MAMKTYSFKNNHFFVNGVELTHLADGDDAIMAKFRQDRAQDKVGADGNMSVAISADKSGEITVKLMQTSPSNRFLLGLTMAQDNGPETAVPILVMMQDTFRQDRAVGSSGYIKSVPEITRGANVNTQEWVFVVERLDLVLGAV